MKKFVIIWLCFQPIIFSQYYGERVTDQSFEKSSLYFNSHFLNTYGVYQFKDVAVGLVDDPFLNIYMNPALLPDIGDKDVYLYLDFRGDRTEVPIVEIYPWRDYYYGGYFAPPMFDRRWFTTTSVEPEPIVSFGLITYPISENRNFFIGGSYQLVYNEDKFYTVPYYIYSPLLEYDSFNNRLAINDVPIVERYSGKDEMINETHRFTTFTGYNFSDKFSLGLSIDGVFQSKNGEFSNTSRDEYGSMDNSDWNSSNLTGRTDEYDHLDYSLGLMYSPFQSFSVGIKTGYLDGDVSQDLVSANSYFSSYNEPFISEEWYRYYSDYSNKQYIDHDGSSKYIGFNFKKLFNNGSYISGYYRYTYSDVSVATSSVLVDTSDYSSRWTYNNGWGQYSGYSSVQDDRTGTGSRTTFKHEGLVSLNWNLNDITSVSVGLYVKNELYQISNGEDVVASRFSEWNHIYSNQPPYNYLIALEEDKSLEWEYESRITTYQIPLILEFRFNEYWGFMLGVSRILNSWRIIEQTTAYFERRYRNENGVISEENNFGERYIQPTERISENFFDVLAGFNLNITKEFGMQLLLDPEIDPDLRVAQWWLAFRAGL